MIRNPLLFVQEISDQYIRKNFESLKSYFESQNQFLDFQFFDLTFTSAVTGYKKAHGLAYAPLDVVVTRLTGSGKVTFRYDQFDTKQLVLDTTGPCRVRFYAGLSPRLTANTPSGATDAQTFSASPLASSEQVAAAISIPAGVIVGFGGVTAPSGWLLCDGSSVSRVQYAALFSAIRDVHGAASATTFNLPDHRGRFLRGVDGTAGNDPDSAGRTAMNAGGAVGNSVGSVQADQIASHQHPMPRGPNVAGGNYALNDLYNLIPFGGYESNPVGGAAGGNETRPKNAYVNWIIKT